MEEVQEAVRGLHVAVLVTLHVMDPQHHLAVPGAHLVALHRVLHHVVVAVHRHVASAVHLTVHRVVQVHLNRLDVPLVQTHAAVAALQIVHKIAVTIALKGVAQDAIMDVMIVVKARVVQRVLGLVRAVA